MRFYLGTHKPQWLRFPEFTDVPLFLSHRTLRERKRGLPRSLAPFCVDSGGFTELQKFGRWTVSPEEYVDALRGYRDQTGAMVWAAPQDWMCERVVIEGGTLNGVTFAGTGLSVREHQHRTVANFLQLRDLAPDLAIIPVLQGEANGDYLRCLDLYRSAGVDLRTFPTVGVGSVCRRQATAEIGDVMRTLWEEGLSLHGFGVKKTGLRLYGKYLTSADSLAWSFDARRKPPTPGHTHKACNNCPEFALAWRARLLASIPPEQTALR